MLLEAQERLAQIAPLQNGLQAAWPTLKPYLEQRRREQATKLLMASHEIDTNQCRGRIKEIDDLLGLPERLQQEAMNLQQPQQEGGDLP